MQDKRDIFASLNFFRTLPDEVLEIGPLLSSFQSFETALFLIALGRYPSALVNCINAWESALKAGMKITRDERSWALEDLLNNAVISYPALERHSRSSVTDARRLRNDLVHFGASPGHDNQSLSCLLLVGFPYLVFTLQRNIWYLL